MIGHGWRSTKALGVEAADAINVGCFNHYCKSQSIIQGNHTPRQSLPDRSHERSFANIVTFSRKERCDFDVAIIANDGAIFRRQVAEFCFHFRNSIFIRLPLGEDAATVFAFELVILYHG